MKSEDLQFPEIGYDFPVNLVRGTGNGTYLFGVENEQRRIAIRDFAISAFPVTTKLWQYIMDGQSTDDTRPAVFCSYDMITGPGGFFEKLQAITGRQFRLPTETEWEYSARGGPSWGDYYLFSGGDNIDELAWYKQNSGNETKPVGLKKPNQLGLYDMCGNVWEWCQDWYIRDSRLIPTDGTAYMHDTKNKVLRGGCFHNGAIHCTVSKRYEIPPDSFDECIGFRIVTSVD
jgi:sulfatase modifying factor 1